MSESGACRVLLLEVARQIVLPTTDDFNSGEQVGIGLHQVTQKGGMRCSAAAGYLHPASDRRNLSVTTGAHGTRLQIEGGR